MVDGYFLPSSHGAPASRQLTGWSLPNSGSTLGRLGRYPRRHGPNRLVEVLALVTSQEKLSLWQCFAYHTHCREQALCPTSWSDPPDKHELVVFHWGEFSPESWAQDLITLQKRPSSLNPVKALFPSPTARGFPLVYLDLCWGIIAILATPIK